MRTDIQGTPSKEETKLDSILFKHAPKNLEK